MRKAERKDIWFDSASGNGKTIGYIYTNPDVPPFCVLQISHGMCEHIPRYEEFAGYLASNGVVLCGNDHIGHGESAASPSDYGFFGQQGGRMHAIQDLATMNRILRNEFPSLPVAMLGHSMGSFFARRYATLHPESLQALVICATGGPNLLIGPSILITRILSRLKGPRYRSNLIHQLAFGTYLRKIPKPETQYDWISRDTKVVRQYSQDPKCTFRFTVNGFHELSNALREVSSMEWAAEMPKKLPVLMIQGDADPVGNYGRGTQKVREWLQKAGVEQLDYKLYPGMRHEVLNEVGRQQVYYDVLEFLQQVMWPAGKKPPLQTVEEPTGSAQAQPDSIEEKGD